MKSEKKLCEYGVKVIKDDEDFGNYCCKNFAVWKVVYKAYKGLFFYLCDEHKNELMRRKKDLKNNDFEIKEVKG
jgi:thioredoxin-related protein